MLTGPTGCQTPQLFLCPGFLSAVGADWMPFPDMRCVLFSSKVWTTQRKECLLILLSLHLSLLFYCSKTYSEASVSKMAKNSNQRLLQIEKSMLQWTNFQNIFSHQREIFLLCTFFFPEMWCSKPFCLMFELLDKEVVWKVVMFKYDPK